MNPVISGSQLAIAILLVFVFILALIIFMKMKLAKIKPSELLEKHKNDKGDSPLENRTKYSEVNAFNLSKIFLSMGIVFSLLLVILAFSWTQFEDFVIPEGALEMEEDIKIEAPPQTKQQKPPPPPPPPEIEEVPEEEIIEDEQPEIMSTEVEVEQEVIAEPVVEDTKPAPPPPPPPPPPEPEVEEIFKVVEDAPRFPGCNSGSKAEKKKCATEKMLKFIYANIKYPAIARENGIEGTTVVTFVVEKDGSITDARVVRDIGGKCGSEALRVVKKMPKWVPGKQRGRAVRVQFNLPVKFKLQ